MLLQASFTLALRYSVKLAFSQFARDAMKEMFSASEEKFCVKYSNYIGNWDSKTLKAILELNPCGHTQNANESFNAAVWRLSPKHLHSGLKIIEMSA